MTSSARGARFSGWRDAPGKSTGLRAQVRVHRRVGASLDRSSDRRRSSGPLGRRIAKRFHAQHRPLSGATPCVGSTQTDVGEGHSPLPYVSKHLVLAWGTCCMALAGAMQHVSLRISQSWDRYRTPERNAHFLNGITDRTDGRSGGEASEENVASIVDRSGASSSAGSSCPSAGLRAVDRHCRREDNRRGAYASVRHEPPL